MRQLSRTLCFALTGMAAALGAVHAPCAEWPGFPPVVSTSGLTKTPGIYGESTYETTPIIFQGQPILFATNSVSMSLSLKDLYTGKVISTFGTEGDGYALGSAFVNGSQINVFATKYSNSDWTQDIYRFTSTDMVNWSTPTLAVARSGSEHLLNSSVCWDGHRYIMAYESNVPMQWSTRFAQSTDLEHWQKLETPTFLGAPGTEGANPTIRHIDNYYYLLYSTFWPDGRDGWVTYLARSQDLSTWEFSDQKNPVLQPADDEGINNSDPDLFEFNEKTYVFYATGYQTTTGTNTKLAVYDGTMSQFFASYFLQPVPEPDACVLCGMATMSVLVYSWQKRKRSGNRRTSMSKKRERLTTIAMCAILPLCLGTTARAGEPSRLAPPNPKLVKLPLAPDGLRMENTPVVFKGRPLLVENYRSWDATKPEEQEKSYLFIGDVVTGQEIARFGTGFTFVSAFVNGDQMNVFATMNTNKQWTKDIYRFYSTDLKKWNREIAIKREGDEHLFNSSVCRDDHGYLMAYESNKPVQWSFRFARSKDLSKWEKVQGLEFLTVKPSRPAPIPRSDTSRRITMLSTEFTATRFRKYRTNTCCPRRNTSPLYRVRRIS